MFYENGWVKFYGEDGLKLARRHAENMSLFQAATIDLLGSEYEKQIEKAISNTNFVYFGNSCVDDLRVNQTKIIRQVCEQQDVSEIDKNILLKSNFDLSNSVSSVEYQLFSDFMKATYPKVYRNLKEEKLDALYYYVKNGVRIDDQDSITNLIDIAEGEDFTIDEIKEKVIAYQKGYKKLLDAYKEINKKSLEYFMNYLDEAGILDRIRSFNLSNKDFANLLSTITEKIYSNNKCKSFALPVYSNDSFYANNIIVFGDITPDIVGLMLEAVVSDMGWLDNEYVYKIGFASPQSEVRNGLEVMWVDWCAHQIVNKMNAMGASVNSDVSVGQKNLNAISSYLDPFFEENKAEMANYFFTAYNKKLVDKIGQDMFDKINNAADLVEEVRFLSSDKEVSAACKIAQAVTNIKENGTLQAGHYKNDVLGCDIEAIKIMTQSLLGLKDLVDGGKKKD